MFYNLTLSTFKMLSLTFIKSWFSFKHRAYVWSCRQWGRLQLGPQSPRPCPWYSRWCPAGGHQRSPWCHWCSPCGVSWSPPWWCRACRGRRAPPGARSRGWCRLTGRWRSTRAASPLQRGEDKTVIKDNENNLKMDKHRFLISTFSLTIFCVRGVKWEQFLCDYVTFSSPPGRETTQFSWFCFSYYENGIVKRHGYSFHPPAKAAKSRDSVTMGGETTCPYGRRSEITNYCPTGTTAGLHFTLHTHKLNKLLPMCLHKWKWT